MGAGPILIASSVLSAGASVMNYFNTADAMADQASTALSTSRLVASQYTQQSAFNIAQANAMRVLSGAYMNQAAAFSTQAGIAARTGSILMATEMHKASQAEKEGEQRSAKAAERRRLFIGQGKAKFAANGVLIDSRPQSAVNMWEQDEIADLAFELHGIKEEVENEVWGHIWNGYHARMQGLFDAQALELQAEGARIEAGNANLSADGFMMESRINQINAQTAILEGHAAAEAAENATDAALWDMIGSIGGTGMNLSGFFAGRSGSLGSTRSTGSTRTAASSYGSTPPVTGRLVMSTGNTMSPLLD